MQKALCAAVCSSLVPKLSGLTRNHHGRKCSAAPGVRSLTNCFRAANLPHTLVFCAITDTRLAGSSECTSQDQLSSSTNHILTSVYLLRYTITMLYLFDMCFLTEATGIQALDNRTFSKLSSSILGRCCYLVFETALNQVGLSRAK